MVSPDQAYLAACPEDLGSFEVSPNREEAARKIKFISDTYHLCRAKDNALIEWVEKVHLK